MKAYPKWFFPVLALCLLLILLIEAVSYPHMLAHVPASPAPAWFNVLVIDSITVVFWGLFVVVWRLPSSIPRWWKVTILAGCAFVVILILQINLVNWR